MQWSVPALMRSIRNPSASSAGSRARRPRRRPAALPCIASGEAVAPDTRRSWSSGCLKGMHSCQFDDFSSIRRRSVPLSAMCCRLGSARANEAATLVYRRLGRSFVLVPAMHCSARLPGNLGNRQTRRRNRSRDAFGGDCSDCGCRHGGYAVHERSTRPVQQPTRDSGATTSGQSDVLSAIAPNIKFISVPLALVRLSPQLAIAK